MSLYVPHHSSRGFPSTTWKETCEHEPLNQSYDRYYLLPLTYDEKWKVKTSWIGNAEIEYHFELGQFKSIANHSTFDRIRHGRPRIASSYMSIYFWDGF